MMENSKDQVKFLAVLTDARREWLQAQNYFENVSEPDLVDYAIFKLEAAKLRYMYLIKQARILGFQNNQVIQEEADGMFN